MNERQKVIAAITGTHMLAKCEICGHDNWLLPSKQEDPDSVLKLSMPLWMNLTRMVGFYPMICRNCSNTRFLHDQTLLEGDLGA